MMLAPSNPHDWNQTQVEEAEWKRQRNQKLFVSRKSKRAPPVCAQLENRNFFRAGRRSLIRANMEFDQVDRGRIGPEWMILVYSSQIRGASCAQE